MSKSFYLEGEEIPFDGPEALEVLKIFEAEQERDKRLALKRQNLMAALSSERLVGNDTHCHFQLDPVIYHYWGQRLGYECWEDTGKEGFVTEMLRDNPELRIKNVRKNPMISMSGGRNVRESINFGEI